MQAVAATSPSCTAPIDRGASLERSGWESASTVSRKQSWQESVTHVYSKLTSAAFGSFLGLLHGICSGV